MFQDGYLYGTNGFSAFDFGREVIKAIEEADVDLGQGQAMIRGTKSQSACRGVNLARGSVSAFGRVPSSRALTDWCSPPLPTSTSQGSPGNKPTVPTH